MPPSETHQRFYKKSQWHFPFSIWYLGTYYKSLGYDITLWDMNLDYSPPNQKWEKVGISCITSQVSKVKELCKLFKKEGKDTEITVGGIHPTLYPKQTLAYEYIDKIQVGHAIKDFANMPMLDYSLLDKQMMAQKDKNFIGLVASIGCPFKCTFCVNSIISEYNQWQGWSARRICDEIEKAQSYGFKNVFFWDDNFFVNKKRVEEFVENVNKRHLKFEWFAFTRCDHVDRKLFKMCYDIGLRRVALGGESGNQEVLDKLNKGITLSDIYESARILNNLGIESNYSYMIGLPNETKKDIYMTVNHLKEMGKILDYPKIAGPMLYCPWPGSKLYEECKKYGWEEPKRFEDWTDFTTGIADNPYKLPWIKHKDMTQIYWFYTFFIPVSYRKILRLFWLYIRRTNRNKLWLFLLPPIFLIATVGKLRHSLRFYRFPIETFLFKRIRGIMGS